MALYWTSQAEQYWKNGTAPMPGGSPSLLGEPPGWDIDVLHCKGTVNGSHLFKETLQPKTNLVAADLGVILFNIRFAPLGSWPLYER